MQANPDKFQSIAIGKKTNYKSSEFKLGDSNISCKEVVKLVILGNDFDFKLTFDFHIANCSAVDNS